MIVNVVMASRAFDPYPFILLNLVLSCVAAIQAPLIMMSQNRQEDKDRRRAVNDYKVNLKTEIMIEDLYDKINIILSKQSALEKQFIQARKKRRAFLGKSFFFYFINFLLRRNKYPLRLIRNNRVAPSPSRAE